jgi:hypothetical protein
MRPHIQIINQSTVVSDSDIKDYTEALQIQVTRDFSQHWNINCVLTFVPKGQTPDPNQWWLVVLDDSNVQNALGYHDLTPKALPLGKVFAKTDLQYGDAVSVTMSHELCLTGDVRISLLNGTEIAIKDLVGVDHFYVYSCNGNGEIRPGRGHSARLTRKNAEIVKVTLDNGESIRCTPDHPFLMRDGTYRQAVQLQSGDSLMPLYRRITNLDETKKRKGISTYEQVYDPKMEKWIYTHRMVVPYCSSGYVRHHKDFNRFNNAPVNIEVMKWQDHSELHAKHIQHYARLNKGKKRNVSLETRQGLAERGRSVFLQYNGSQKHASDLKAYLDTPGVRKEIGNRLRPWAQSAENLQRLQALRETPELKEISRNNITAYNKSEEHRVIARKIGREAMTKMWANPDAVANIKASGSVTMQKLHANEEFRFRHLQRATVTCHNRWHVKRGIINPDCALCCPPIEVEKQPDVALANHKVISVERCGTEDVYDITVDKYHNFATSTGVFVHNCEMLGDPLINESASNNDGNLIFGWEACDAVERDELGYNIKIKSGRNVLVSDFQLHSWWCDAPGQDPNTKYDFLGHCSKPFQVLPGGYASYIDLRNPGAGWQEITADGHNVAARKPHGSRFERRRRFHQPHQKPVLSTVKH